MLQPPPRDFAAVYPRFCVVAIPVKDEAERLPACLEALAAQREARGLASPRMRSASCSSPTIARTAAPLSRED